MQVQPLHRWRWLTDPGSSVPMITAPGEDAGGPVYGNRSYLTHDGQFYIWGDHGQWRISWIEPYTDISRSVDEAGLLSVRFPRRRDAVEALEAFMEASE